MLLDIQFFAYQMSDKYKKKMKAINVEFVLPY